MSIWIEIDCDAKLSSLCKSRMEDTPTGRAGNRRYGKVVGNLLQEAIFNGWRYWEGKLVCPECFKLKEN